MRGEALCRHLSFDFRPSVSRSESRSGTEGGNGDGSVGYCPENRFHESAIFPFRLSLRAHFLPRPLSDAVLLRSVRFRLRAAPVFSDFLLCGLLPVVALPYECRSVRFWEWLPCRLLRYLSWVARMQFLADGDFGSCFRLLAWGLRSGYLSVIPCGGMQLLRSAEFRFVFLSSGFGASIGVSFGDSMRRLPAVSCSGAHFGSDFRILVANRFDSGACRWLRAGDGALFLPNDGMCLCLRAEPGCSPSCQITRRFMGIPTCGGRGIFSAVFFTGTPHVFPAGGTVAGYFPSCGGGG